MHLRIVFVLLATVPAAAQPQYLINDRNSDAVFRVFDQNQNGLIDEPIEVNLYFNAANASGTLGPMNPSTLAIHGNGVAVMGDQINRNIYRFCDLNHDGDAQDAGESMVIADATNASAASFAFPTGAAFDSQGRLYVTNAGNASGFDRIFRLVDLNGDGDCQDTDEITEYVGGSATGFNGGNGAFSPQEIFFDASDVGYLRESATTFQGVWRFADGNANGHADDPGEFTAFFTAASVSGITPSAGFAIEPDRIHPGSIYALQTATGSLDQLIRLTDLNADNDAQDADEAVIVWSTLEADFLNIDMVCLTNGDVLITNSDADVLNVIRLTDANADGDFLDASERVDFFDNTGSLNDIRQIAILPTPGDVDGDHLLTNTDIPPFVDVLLGVDTAVMHVIASDLDCNGRSDGIDIAGFVELILSP